MALPLMFRTIAAIAVVMSLLAGYMLFRDTQEKEAFEKINGNITFIDKQFGKWPIRHQGKYRYIQLDSYPYTFELFVGKEPGDFKPRFEQVDALKVGDPVTVYQDGSGGTEEGISRNVMFIDKNGVSYFEKGNSTMAIGIAIFIIAGLLVLFAYYQWKKGKIPF